MRVRILSRASDLARLQAMLVGRALTERFPDVQVSFATRTSAGDRDAVTPLASFVEKGAFTADLSDALGSGDADAVVHSWKDLPLEDRPGTTLAATLERADPRDLLLVRREVLAERPAVLDVLSSSPRRAWLLQSALPGLLPWPVERVRFLPVRGNMTTRLSKLFRNEPSRAHALVVAKAALDRLLGFGPPFDETARDVRRTLDQCAWMVLPIRDVPAAPAQGALAVETARTGVVQDVFRAISHQPTWDAVIKEREVLASYGGGCHEALGATVLPRDYGRVVSIRGQSAGGRRDDGWSLIDGGPAPPRAAASEMWPRPDERQRATRRALDVSVPADDTGFWVARAEALPDAWMVDSGRLVWAAGGTTWRRLAARGVWVHGCADGLGDAEAPGIDLLAGRPVAWHRLTHAAAANGDPNAIATYAVDEPLPENLRSRTHFFWTSGTLFLAALARWPEIRRGWHGTGPGRTWRTVSDALGPGARARVWLDYEDWRRDTTGETEN